MNTARFRVRKGSSLSVNSNRNKGERFCCDGIDYIVVNRDKNYTSFKRIDTEKVILIKRQK